MTDVERPWGYSAPRSGGRVWRLQWALSLVVALVIVSSCTVAFSSRPSFGATISNERAKAQALQSEVTQEGQQIDGLDQQYEAALAKKLTIDSQIDKTRISIAKTELKETKDRALLQKAVIKEYVNGKSSMPSVFTGNQVKALQTKEYSGVVDGNLSVTLTKLSDAQNQLAAEKKQLSTEQIQAASALNEAQAADSKAKNLEAQKTAALSAVNATIKSLMNAQQNAANAAAEAQQAAALAAARAAAQFSGGGLGGDYGGGGGAPPAPGGPTAVAAAESQIGVPYVWGDESPGQGFDCSGLTAWAWGQAGVSLPHYSGGQMADSTPVPLSDLEPGDLLFYGPGGSQHVAMYVGNGEMIEAPYTGAFVWVTALRTGTPDFAGAGRP